MATVMTVSGEIDGRDLGVTLPHEHVFINLVREYRGEGLLNDYGLMKQELAAFKDAGGTTIVDCTTNDIARDPRLLRSISQDTGVNIVMGCGYYRDPYIDRAHVDERSVAELADELVRDLTVGVGDSGVRAGIIGEIGADKWYVSAPEERSFRAAARAHHRTGSTITTHAARWTVGLPQLEILTSEGVDPGRVVIGHCDMVPVPEYHLELARRGAYVEFDTIRGETEYDLEARAAWVLNLVRAGHLDRILLSHDICLRSLLHISGGPGYDLIFRDFLPRLRRAGLNDGELHELTVENPRRALTGASA